MAKEFRFFRIGEANKEIERLEAQVSDLTTKLTAATSGDSAEVKEISEQAAKLKTENETLAAQISTLKAEKETAENAARTAIETASKTISTHAEKVKVEASSQALSIAAAQGIPPARGEKAETESEKTKGRLEKSPFNRVRAAIAAEPVVAQEIARFKARQNANS